MTLRRRRNKRNTPCNSRPLWNTLLWSVLKARDPRHLGKVEDGIGWVDDEAMDIERLGWDRCSKTCEHLGRPIFDSSQVAKFPQSSGR